MSYALARLLAHNQDLPSDAREAVRAAFDASGERQTEMLMVAAALVHQRTDLDCADVRELFSL